MLCVSFQSDQFLSVVTLLIRACLYPNTVRACHNELQCAAHQEFARKQREHALTLRACRWGTKMKRDGLAGLRDAEDRVLHDANACYDLISRHRGSVFAERDVHIESAWAFLDK